jgi:hypothetical protein
MEKENARLKSLLVERDLELDVVRELLIFALPTRSLSRNR